MLQCGMSMVLPVSKRGTITLPPAIRRKYGLNVDGGALLIVEERDGELVLTPAAALPLRDISEEQLKAWLQSDEEEMQAFLRAGETSPQGK